MITFFRKLFIKNYKEVTNPKVRDAHGKLAATFGIFSNFIVFIIKIIIGILTTSISIIADSINNLSDMASSVLTLIGFKMSSRPADSKHPYGHQRIEYINGLIISLVIVFVGGLLFIESFNKILDYSYSSINYTLAYITLAILTISIIIKLIQGYFYKKISKIINSVALKASAFDSLSDCISTFVILLGNIILIILEKNSIQIGFSLDGVLGILVSIFILISGIKLIKDESDPLIGTTTSKEYVKKINDYVKKQKVTLGTHDIMCHMYGPTTCYMTIHVEVDASENLILIHEDIDQIEQDVKEKFNVNLTIHIDPVDLKNPEIKMLSSKVNDILKSISNELTFHDLRIVKRNNSDNLLFDIVIPFNFKYNEEYIKKVIDENLNSNKKLYNLIIEFDHSFVS